MNDWQNFMTSRSLLPLGSKLEPPLLPHGERGQRVLEDLLEGEELEEAEVDAGVQAQAALVGANGAVHLHAIALVDLDLALVVDPGHAEHDDPLRLGDALEDLGLAVLRLLVEHGLEGLRNLHDGLMELRLTGVLGPEFGHEFVNESTHVAPSTRRSGLGCAYDSVACHARLRRWRGAPAVYALVYHPAVAMRAKRARRTWANWYTVAKWAGAGGGASRRPCRPRGRQAFAATTRSTTAAVCSMSPSSTSRCVTKRTVHGPSSRQSTPASASRATRSAAAIPVPRVPAKIMLVCTVARSISRPGNAARRAASVRARRWSSVRRATLCSSAYTHLRAHETRHDL